MKALKNLIIFFFVLMVNICYATDITLFDSHGTPTAYIDTENELNIYLWNGKPVAYLDDGSIWDFNGKHLGWFKDGIIRDHGGYAVGFAKGAINIQTQLEPFKNFEQFPPIKMIQEIEPIEPIFFDSWSETPLSAFLLDGRT